MLESLYSSEYDEPNTSIILKAKFYERKSNIVYTKLMNKLSNSEAIILNKTKLERTLRLENHATSIRIQKNRISIENLEKELEFENGISSKKKSPI